MRHKVIIRVKSCHGHTDKVHKVVTCKSHGKGKGAHENHHFEHIDTPPVKPLHQQRRTYKGGTQQQRGVVADPLTGGSADERRLAQALDKNEIGKQGEGNTSKHGNGVAQMALVGKGEHHTR